MASKMGDFNLPHVTSVILHRECVGHYIFHLSKHKHSHLIFVSVKRKSSVLSFVDIYTVENYFT